MMEKHQLDPPFVHQSYRGSKLALASFPDANSLNLLFDTKFVKNLCHLQMNITF